MGADLHIPRTAPLVEAEEAKVTLANCPRSVDIHRAAR